MQVRIYYIGLIDLKRFCLRNFLSTFVKNPQYAVTLRDVDEDDGDDLCTLMVSLMQKGRRSLKDEGENDLSIGRN